MARADKAPQDDQRAVSITARSWGIAGTTVTIVGEVDIAGAAALRRAVEARLGAGHRHLVIDVSATRLLGEARPPVLPVDDDAGARVVVAAPARASRRLLQVLHFDAVITPAESVGPRPTTLGSKATRPAA